MKFRLILGRRKLVNPSLPSRGAWIEIGKKGEIIKMTAMSLPSRGAWIEMITVGNADIGYIVAPLAGSVD